ncbi:cell wall-active antibiotics response protein LiaF [Jeotgalibacillus proteolyticus]|nr:cell wall-active antibiotics response protein LiaF [Jeotgalibacillus proteolyticus]
MFKELKANSISTWVLIAAGLVLIEILFFNNGMLFSLAFSGALLYFGRKSFHRFLGKVMFGLGLLSLIMTILSMFTLKLLLLFFIVYWINHYFQSKKEPEVITPVIEISGIATNSEELIFKRQQLLSTKWVGNQHTPEHTYEWEDIQLQNGIGDIVIDLSNTVLPQGESVISIRSCIGKITIFIPYELDVNIHHSAIAGSADIFDYQSTRLWNESVAFQSQTYTEAHQKVKILTSAWAGDLEVKRV